MSSAVYKVRRRAFASGPEGVSVVEASFEVVDAADVATLVAALKKDSNLIEVRPREILEVTVVETLLSVEQAAKHLVFVESDIPDDMPIGLEYEVLDEILDGDAEALCFYEEYWGRVPDSVQRRAVVINGRVFLAIRDHQTSEIHFVESESIADNEAPTPKFKLLASIGFTEEDSRTSGYDGEELGLLSEEVAIWVTRPDEGGIDYSIIRLQSAEPADHAALILKLMSSQFMPFMAKIMIEGLIGRIPEEFGDEIPEAWVEDEGSWSAITSLWLSPLLTSDNPRSPVRQAILDRLFDSGRDEHFGSWLTEFIDSIVDPNSPHYEKRIARQALVEHELKK